MAQKDLCWYGKFDHPFTDSTTLKRKVKHQPRKYDKAYYQWTSIICEDCRHWKLSSLSLEKRTCQEMSKTYLSAKHKKLILTFRINQHPERYNHESYIDSSSGCAITNITFFLSGVLPEIQRHWGIRFCIKVSIKRKKLSISENTLPSTCHHRE